MYVSARVGNSLLGSNQSKDLIGKYSLISALLAIYKVENVTTNTSY